MHANKQQRDLSPEGDTPFNRDLLWERAGYIERQEDTRAGEQVADRQRGTARMREMEKMCEHGQQPLGNAAPEGDFGYEPHHGFEPRPRHEVRRRHEDVDEWDDVSPGYGHHVDDDLPALA